jgi:methylmalonyl-CoA/ethylmalonyl-CoA epimerase
MKASPQGWPHDRALEPRGTGGARFGQRSCSLSQFVELPNTKIELMEPLGEASTIRGFLEKNPSGGMHHMCYEVDDLIAARDRLIEQGARVLGDGNPKIGAHGKPVLFLHPKDFFGTLIELEQA